VFERGANERREGCGGDCLQGQRAEHCKWEKENGVYARWLRTLSRPQRAAVSEMDMWSHARVNSKSVRGAAGATRAAVSETAAESFGGSAAVGAGAGTTSRVLKTVSFPDMRKIPPPTRPTDFASRACFASAKDAGFGFCVAGAASGVEFGEGVSVRELMGFRRLPSPSARWALVPGVEG